MTLEHLTLRAARELLVNHRDHDTDKPLEDQGLEARARLIHAGPDLLAFTVKARGFVESLAANGDFQMYELDELLTLSAAAIHKTGATPTTEKEP